MISEDHQIVSRLVNKNMSILQVNPFLDIKAFLSVCDQCRSKSVVRNSLMNQKANSLDPDQTAWMCRLIWI
jgi:hypothetical protein